MNAAAPEELLMAYADALSRLDLPALHSLWDDQLAGPFYVVDELHDPILTWADLEHQWQRLRARVRSAQLRVTAAKVRELQDGVALAYGVLDWRFVGVDSDDVRSGQSRLFVVARLRADGWRLVALFESPIHAPPNSA